MKPTSSRLSAVRKAVFAVVQACFLGSTMLAAPIGLGTAVAAGNPSANLDQCANDPAPSPDTNGCATSDTQWVNGNLGASKSFYLEGDSIAYRMRFDNLSLGSHTVHIEWDTAQSGKHAIDYLTTWNRTVADSDPCLGVTGCSGSPTTFAIPKDPQVDNGSGSPISQIAGNFSMWGATITSVSSYTYPDGTGFAGNKSADLTITFTASATNPVMAWGGHISDHHAWGPGTSAVSIPGSPYHMRLIDLDGSGGNQDRSLSADAVTFPASITVIKDATPNGSTSFPFTGSPSPLTSFNLVDNGTSANTKVFSGITSFTTYSVAESVPSGWQLTGRNCSVSNGNGGGWATNGSTGVNVTLKEGEDWTCTFSDGVIPAPHLSIVKTATESSYSAVGDVIHYSIVATNDGNVTLGAVTVTDPNASGLSCTPANGSSLAPGASMTCTASHTVVQADLDAGHYYNQACVDDGPAGAAQACSDVTTPANQSAVLGLTKSDDLNPAHYNTVGQVVTYTLTAKNNGNVTLHNVTVSDSPALAGFGCTPATPVASLAPGASVVCTGTHAITQADLDAGSFLDTASASSTEVDAPDATDTIYADQHPHLAIVKHDLTGGYSAVGDVISYSIVATNDGNVTLASVTVTDPNASGLSCTPANGSSLAPGASMSCTASHTVTQADLDAGHYANQACVDDGPGGAGQACSDVNTPGTQNPALSITKVATEQGFSNLGDVIHYTIVATNTGNVTLHGVDVTDAQVSNLSCSPTTPVADLAPGATINCTASHTISQADLDAGSYYNQACVDDGAGGAASKCADVSTPGSKNPHLSIVKTATESSYSAVGDVIHYSIVATNDGNVTLGAVTVTDPNASGLSCTPANGSSLAPGASMTCTASHTVVQADLDAGHYYNQACVDDGPAGAAQACSDVTVDGNQNPHLSIVKTATEDGYSALGDVIHYTIVATNDGNVTLHGVDVTDAQVSDLSCSPTTPVTDLAPQGTITCTASHTIVQADLDAGSFYNQACVDDVEGPAAKACDDVTVDGSQNPHLSIVKRATEDGFSKVGDVIHYTIVATNDGNVTLHDVVVTDPDAVGLSCSPSTPVTDLAPLGTITCTASHTVTQADIDAGSYLNQACVDDGEGGADQACFSVTVEGSQSPNLSITKTAAEKNYTKVGDVIHYTIVATNTGDVTLHDVVVTDPNASSLACSPSLPVADLAPGAKITCTASHTVTDADLVATHYTNEACVDDGEGGADQACADVDTPAFFPPLPPTLSGLGDRPAGGDSSMLILSLLIGLLAAAAVILAPMPKRRRSYAPRGLDPRRNDPRNR